MTTTPGSPKETGRPNLRCHAQNVGVRAKSGAKVGNWDWAFVLMLEILLQWSIQEEYQCNCVH